MLSYCEWVSILNTQVGFNLVQTIKQYSLMSKISPAFWDVQYIGNLVFLVNLSLAGGNIVKWENK